MSLDRLFSPNSILFVGASDQQGRTAGRPLYYARQMFEGDIFVTSRGRSEVQGLPAVTAPGAIPAGIDLAVITLPAVAVEDALELCIERKVGAAIVIAGGFAEVGDAGAVRQARLHSMVADSGMRMLGPNTVGLVNLRRRLIATFSGEAARSLNRGPVAVISASGYGLVNTFEAARTRNLGIDIGCHIGNGADITLTETMAYLADDDDIQDLLVYLEGFRPTDDVRAAFHHVATCRKNLVVYRAGATAEGARAAATHTGAIIADNTAFLGLARESGAIVVDSIEAMVDVALLLRQRKPVNGRRIAIITGSGGVGVMQADRAVRRGLAVPTSSEALVKSLVACLPPHSAASNPIDGTSDLARHPKAIAEAIRLVDSSGEFDAVLVKAGTTEADVGPIFDEVLVTAQFLRIPLACVWNLPKDRADQARKGAIACYGAGSDAVDAIAFAAARRATTGTANEPHPHVGQIRLAWNPTEETLRSHGIPLVPTVSLADNGAWDDYVDLLGCPPWVLKVDAPSIDHRTEIGGVELGVADAAQFDGAYARLTRLISTEGIAEARIVAEPQVFGGQEVLISLLHDQIVGWSVVVGFGGQLAEVVAEVAATPCPVIYEQADACLAELFGGRWASHGRGLNPLQRTAICDLMVKVGELPVRYADVGEVEMNPVLVTETGAIIVVDWIVR